MKIPEEISGDFVTALLAENPIPKLVKVMLEGLEAEMPHGVNGTIENYAVRLTYVKAWAEWCNFVKPTPAGQDSNSATEEIIERIQRLIAGGDSENPPETQPV